MTSEYTGGPWAVAPGEDNHGGTTDVACAIKSGGWHIARVWESGPNPEADARLIAAAPDLLAALKGLRKALREVIKLDVRKHYSLMVADAGAGSAITKAEGAGS